MNRIVPEAKQYKKTALAIIIGFSLLRCAIAFSMELGTDEAYYWLYSQEINWNYFDHPPMVALWIRISTANLALQNLEGWIRLGSIAGCAFSAWAIYKTMETIHSPKAGLFGVCLYHASFFASVTAGIFIMPDSPQMVFYTLALWMLARILQNEKSSLAWIFFGVAAGLCIMSKVYGAFLWSGLGLFAITRRKGWFSQPYFYVSLLLTVAISSPILIWNLQNNFFTYRFHSGRVTGVANGIDPISFGREIINQVLYNNPFNVAAIVAALTAFFSKKKENHAENEVLWLFNFIALPQVIFFLLLSSMGVLTLPHWSGPAYITLMPVVATYLSSSPFAKKLLLSSLITLLVFFAGWQYLIHFAPKRTAENKLQDKSFYRQSGNVQKLFSGFEKFQLIADTKGSWKPAGIEFLNLYREETASGIMEKNAPVLCYKWWGAHVEYYFCRPGNIQMIGLGDPNDLHQYLFTNKVRKDKVNMATAYCVVPADDPYDVQEKFGKYYRQIDTPTALSAKKGKKQIRFYVYRLRGWKSQLPMAVSRIDKSHSPLPYCSLY